VHVDVCKAFYTRFRSRFWKCDPNNEREYYAAAHGVLVDISNVITKCESILYLDGDLSEDRILKHDKRLASKLKFEERFYKELAKYRQTQSIDQYKLLMKVAENLFIITRQIESIFMDVCIQNGWCIVRATGEAELEIARRGGIVLTQDSDLIFHPTIDAVVRPIENNIYYYYQKVDVLHTLNITSEALTALAILSENDYTPDQYPSTGIRNKYYKLHQYCETLRDTILVHDNEDRALSPVEITEAMIQKFLISMHHGLGIHVPLETYESSIRIFALQQEKLISKADKIQAAIKNSFYYYCLIQDRSQFLQRNSDE
jgi:hypothetical protein